MSDASADNLTRLFPAKSFSEEDRDTIFQHFFRRLAAYRNTAELYALAEYNLSSLSEDRKTVQRDSFNASLNTWAQELLDHAWNVCDRPGGGDCPQLDPYSDTSTKGLPPLPSPEKVAQALNTILLLQITGSKEYSARTNAFLSSLGPLDEDVIVSTLKNPGRVLEEAQKHAQETTQNHADRGKTLRMLGMGLGAVAGGVLVGVTGGLAAPLVGGAVATIFGWLGIGGTAAGLLASGLAGSSVVCGALFGAYGANSSASMVKRHTREIRDLAIAPVKQNQGEDSLGVRICVSGWLSSVEDVTAPWTIWEGWDTFALQWEVDALKGLSDAFYMLMKSTTMKYVRSEILRRTALSSLMTSLAPIALLNIGQIMDNPWMNCKALAIKAGAVLGDLLAKRVFGKRPMTLVGYSLGSLVIFEALKHLASLPPSETIGLIQDVFLFGSPITTKPSFWAGIRRLASGRLMNGHSDEDYVLAVLSRASEASWKVAGLYPVDVMGIENVLCEHVDGHTKWRGLIGRSLQATGATGVIDSEVEKQVKTVAELINRDLDMSPEEADELLKKGRSNEL